MPGVDQVREKEYNKYDVLSLIEREKRRLRLLQKEMIARETGGRVELSDAEKDHLKSMQDAMEMLTTFYDEETHYGTLQV